MRTRFWSTTLSLLLGGVLLSCERKGRDVPVGHITSLTGENATFGQSQKQGFQMAIDECNLRGGVLGRPVRMVLADDKGDAGEGATVFAKVIERDKVAIIVGPAVSKIGMAGAPIAQAAGIPMITPSCTHEKITAVGDWIFRACFTDAAQGAAGGRIALQNLKARKAACLYDLGSDYTVGLAEGFRKTYTSLGGQVTGFEGHASGTVDFKAQLTKMLKGKPDLLYLPDYYGDVGLIARQARELGFQGALLGGDGWDSAQLIKIGGRALENGYFTTHCSKDDPDPTVQRFQKDYVARYKTDPDAMAIVAYDACNIALDAIRRAGTTEASAVKIALRATNLRTVSGQITFDAQRNPVKPVTLVEIKDGRQIFRGRVDG